MRPCECWHKRMLLARPGSSRLLLAPPALHPPLASAVRPWGARAVLRPEHSRLAGLNISWDTVGQHSRLEQGSKVPRFQGVVYYILVCLLVGNHGHVHTTIPLGSLQREGHRGAPKSTASGGLEKPRDFVTILQFTGGGISRLPACFPGGRAFVPSPAASLR